MTTHNYRTLNALMRHIRDDAGISIRGSAEKRALAQLGYFHAYKGYRYSGAPSKRIPYSNFAELRAVVTFDTKLKAIFYPLLMQLEMNMKNLALVEMLAAADSSSLPDIYARLMPGDKKNGMRGKLEVIHASNGALLAAYKRKNAIAAHYFESSLQTVPLWGLMEIVTLGHFAQLLEQLSDPVLNRIAASWGLPRKYGELTPRLVFAVTGLRNGVAHNGVVFDTRFQTAKVRDGIPALLKSEIGYAESVQIRFDTITDYLLLLAFLASCLGLPKREVRELVREFSSAAEDLFERVPLNIFSMIVHSDSRSKVRQLESWLQKR